MLHQIRKIAKEIYVTLGTGHNEVIYHKAMEVELRNLKVPYASKAPVSIYYKNHIVGYHEPDLILYHPMTTVPDIIIELKASVKPRTTDQSQLLCYMRNLQCDKGILINFPQLSNKGDKPSDIDYFHIGFEEKSSVPMLNID